MDAPPRPVAVGSPVWIIKFWRRAKHVGWWNIRTRWCLHDIMELYGIAQGQEHKTATIWSHHVVCFTFTTGWLVWILCFRQNCGSFKLTKPWKCACSIIVQCSDFSCKLVKLQTLVFMNNWWDKERQTNSTPQRFIASTLHKLATNLDDSMEFDSIIVASSCLGSKFEKSLYKLRQLVCSQYIAQPLPIPNNLRACRQMPTWDVRGQQNKAKKNILHIVQSGQ